MTEPLSRPIRVAVMPSLAEGNPHRARLYEALGSRDVVVVGGEMKPWWPARHQTDVDLVHLHWIESLMVGGAGRLAALRTVAAAASIELTLRTLRRRRIPVVWTLHNKAAHYSAAPAVHRWLNRRAARLVDAMIVYSEYGAGWARAHLHPACQITVSPHLNYIGAYSRPSPLSADRLRDRYGIPASAPLLLCFGAIQEYKRVPEVVASFAAIDAPDARLLIIGHPGDGRDIGRLRRQAAADPRVILDPRPVEDHEVPAVFAAADVTVVNYEALSSGVLMLALSFGCPVLAPDTGVARETGPPPAVQTYASGQLTGAIAAALSSASGGSSRALATAVAERYPPERQAAEHVRVYERAIATTRRR